MGWIVFLMAMISAVWICFSNLFRRVWRLFFWYGFAYEGLYKMPYEKELGKNFRWVWDKKMVDFEKNFSSVK